MNAGMINIAIAGATGRMGKQLVAAVMAADDMRLALALGPEGHEALGTDSGEYAGVSVSGLPIVTAAAADADFDVMIDFSAASALDAHLALCKAHGAALVLGTTPTRSQEAHYQQALHDAASNLAILAAPNISLNVNVLFKLVEQAARTLATAEPELNMEILEMHRRDKKDAPSGTARHIGEIMANATGGRFEERRRNHQAEDGVSPPKDAIGFSVIRGGEFACDHTAMFFLPGAELHIKYRANDRSPFISGALHAVRWLNGREAGLYGMDEVLGDSIFAPTSPAEQQEESAKVRAVPMSQRTTGATKIRRRRA